MRFRCQIKKVSLMHKIVKSLSAMAKQCTIKLSRDLVHFIVPGNEAGPEGMQIWSQVKVATLFDLYRIESRGDNTIYLEVASLEHLGKALRSAENAGPGFAIRSRTDDQEEGVIMKLGKKDNQAVLIFEIHGFTSSGHRMEVKHDVAVRVLTPAQVKELKEPMCPTPDIHVQLPNLGQLKGIVSKMSHMGSWVKVSANLNGEMIFSMKEGGLQLETRWENLTIPKFNNQAAEVPSTPVPPEQFHSVTVSVKSMLKFLSTVLQNSTTIACIMTGWSLVVYIYIGDVGEAAGVLTVFIPGKTDEDS